MDEWQYDEMFLQAIEREANGEEALPHYRPRRHRRHTSVPVPGLLENDDVEAPEDAG